MAAWRRAIELSLGDEDTAKLRSIAQSRTEPASRVERARILLAYREDPSFFAVGRALGLHHQTVQRCVERAVSPGRPPNLSAEQQEVLRQLVEAGSDPEKDGVVRWRCVDLKWVLGERLGVDLSEVSLGRVLKAVQVFAHQRPTPAPRTG
jgi:transposase